MRKFIVGFDIALENPKFRYQAYTDNSTWNGWQNPQFSEAERNRFLKEYYEMSEVKPGESEDFDDHFKDFQSVPPYYDSTLKINLYDFGGCWTWSEFKTMDIAYDGTNEDLI